MYAFITVEETAPVRIYLSKLNDDLENGILQLCKASSFSLTAELKVRFESDAGIGMGPVREFYPSPCNYLKRDFLMFIIQTNVFIFEHQEDHKVKREEPMLRQTGLFVAVGKMIAHSALQGGPGIHGIALAVVHY